MEMIEIIYQMDILQQYRDQYLLHPEHEDIILNSDYDDWELDIWRRSYKDEISLAAYTLYMREERHHHGDTLFASIHRDHQVEWSDATLINIILSHDIDYHIDYISSIQQREDLLCKIWDIDMNQCQNADPSNNRPEMQLLNGLITQENRHWISDEDSHIFFDIHIDEYITLQDELVTELLNAEIFHRCRGYNNTRALLHRDETDEECEKWGNLIGSSEDDGMRGL